MASDHTASARLRLSRDQYAVLLFWAGASIWGSVALRYWFGFHGLSPLKKLLILSAVVLMTAGWALDGRFGGRVRAGFRESIGSRVQVLNWLALVIPLALLTLVIRQFHIGPYVFKEQVSVVLLVGALVHALLPRAFRLVFFLCLSLAIIFGVLGQSNSLWLLGIGLILIGACHIPVRFGWRVMMVLLVGGLLAVFRVGWLQAPWSEAIWPALGAMFGFRLIIYLYDLHHEKKPADARVSLSYFFLLPNPVFPLFPVIDYKTFRRSYYDTESLQIAQVGLRWMVRGIVHLLLYRIVYLYFTMTPAEVANVADLLRHLLANFALYLRVSGYFHLIIGIVHLFGFNLPETNQKYFLAASFTDFWRRINIYWKDFMMKVFYYPAYFRLRQLGETRALVLSTLLVFVVTWFLHAYQWFWMRGSLLLSVTDSLFWAILGGLMIANTLWEAKFGRSRTLRQSRKTPSQTFVHGLKVAGTFTTIVLLWSLWSSGSLQEWGLLWGFRGRGSALTVTWSSVLVVCGVIGLASWLGDSRLQTTKATGAWGLFRPTVALSGAAVVLLLTIHPQLQSYFGPDAQIILRDIRMDALNRRDAELFHRGYYENLAGVERLNSPLGELLTWRPTGYVPLVESEASRATGDFLVHELRPFTNVWYQGITLRTNRWGMRDLDYQKEKAPGTLRIALLGASHEMGMGVPEQAVWETQLEKQLNEELAGRGAVQKFEIWNFSMGGYGPSQRLWLLEKKVGEFNPDVVLCVARSEDLRLTLNHLKRLLKDRIPIPYPYVEQVLARAGVTRDMHPAEAENKLRPGLTEIERWAYRQIAEVSRQRAYKPVWVFVPAPGVPLRETHEQDVQLARELGFTTIDLTGIFDGIDPRSLRVNVWDPHTNEAGHKIVARKLFSALQEHGVIPAGARRE